VQLLTCTLTRVPSSFDVEASDASLNRTVSNSSGTAAALAPVAEEPVFRYAPFWSRFVAWVLDLAIITVATVPVAIGLIWIMEALHGDLRMKLGHARYLAGLGAVFSWVIGGWLYNAQMLSSPRQATYGKRCFSLRVIGSRGRKIGFAQASARHFAKFLSAFIGFVGFIMAAFSRRRQALHDMVADTVVVQD
jgi:uncharacterized RDD family membrane protein YckC